MAQLNITLNQEEILQLLSENKGDAFAKLLQESINCIMKAESAEQLKAEPYERNEERTGSRNGYRERELTTRIGNISLKVPKHRNGEPFKTFVFDNYCRSEAALITSMAEMVVNGVSTRKVAKVMETLCDKSFSKSTVSEACKELDQKVNEFRNRPLDCEYPFITVDATYFKVRENSRIVSKALMIAYAVSSSGVREIIGFDVYKNESKSTWDEFLGALKKRGLRGVRMITSDSHEGIKYAVCKHFPGVPWQRCQFHFKRNICDKTPKKYSKGISDELTRMFQCITIEEARKIRDEIIEDYKDVAESAMLCLDEGFEDAMTVMALPPSVRVFFRTSNQIERENRELKRRSNVIGIFPNVGSLIRLMGAVLMERNEHIMTKNRIFSKNNYETNIDLNSKAKLIEIAKQQRNMMVA